MANEAIIPLPQGSSTFAAEKGQPFLVGGARPTATKAEFVESVVVLERKNAGPAAMSEFVPPSVSVS